MLKKHNMRNALNISGDFSGPFSPSFRYVLFLLYNGRSDWLIPVTQKKVESEAINMNPSNCPISYVVR